MNTGIKNKLKELIGKRIEVFYSDTGVGICYPPSKTYSSKKVLRIEGEDCIVLEGDEDDEFVSIDHIFLIRVRK
jgi:hypothetical protein